MSGERFTDEELRSLAAYASGARNHRLAAKCFRMVGDLVKAETAMQLAQQDPSEYQEERSV